MSVVFEQAEGNGIAYCFTDFRIAHVDYTVVFSDDADSLVYFREDRRLGCLIADKRVCSIKFAVKEHLEGGSDDLYAPPLEHRFGKREIILLKQNLEYIVQAHYAQFKPDAYLFVAERPSLNRMYQKMCTHLSENMLDFLPIMNLGENQDCFFIQTPTY